MTLKSDEAKKVREKIKEVILTLKEPLTTSDFASRVLVLLPPDLQTKMGDTDAQKRSVIRDQTDKVNSALVDADQKEIVSFKGVGLAAKIYPADYIEPVTVAKKTVVKSDFSVDRIRGYRALLTESKVTFLEEFQRVTKEFCLAHLSKEPPGDLKIQLCDQVELAIKNATAIFKEKESVLMNGDANSRDAHLSLILERSKRGRSANKSALSTVAPIEDEDDQGDEESESTELPEHVHTPELRQSGTPPLLASPESMMLDGVRPGSPGPTSSPDDAEADEPASDIDDRRPVLTSGKQETLLNSSTGQDMVRVQGRKKKGR